MTVDVKRAYSSGALVLERLTTSGFRVIQIVSSDETKIREALKLLGLTEFEKDVRPVGRTSKFGVVVAVATPSGDHLRTRWISYLMGGLLPLPSRRR